MGLDSDGLWKINFMNEWPAQVSLSAWGVNPDGQPDVTQIFGDIDGGRFTQVRGKEEKLQKSGLTISQRSRTGQDPSTVAFEERGKFD